jgi:hypothetical protein
VAGLGTDADTKSEITNALNAGMEVTVHQSEITANGWTGSGFIILDPESGAGAYKISGGANGGYYTLVADAASALASIILGALGVSLFFAPVMVGLVFSATSLAILGLSYWVAILIGGGVRDPAYDFYTNLISIMTFLPSLGSETGVYWFALQTFWKYW